MKHLLLVASLLVGCGGGDDEPSSTRTASFNNTCIGEGSGGQAGDACTTPDDCALIACCTCPGSTIMFSAAACNGTCLDEAAACDAAIAQTDAMRCE